MSDFNRTIHPDILALAEGILDAKQLELAEQLSDALLSGEEDKQHAIWHLKEIIGNYRNMSEIVGQTLLSLHPYG